MWQALLSTSRCTDLGAAKIVHQLESRTDIANPTGWIRAAAARVADAAMPKGSCFTDADFGSIKMDSSKACTWLMFLFCFYMANGI